MELLPFDRMKWMDGHIDRAARNESQVQGPFRGSSLGLSSSFLVYLPTDLLLTYSPTYLLHLPAVTPSSLPLAPHRTASHRATSTPALRFSRRRPPRPDDDSHSVPFPTDLKSFHIAGRCVCRCAGHRIPSTSLSLRRRRRRHGLLHQAR